MAVLRSVFTLCALIAGALALFAPSQAAAQDPVRGPVRILYGFADGSVWANACGLTMSAAIGRARREANRSKARKAPSREPSLRSQPPPNQVSSNRNWSSAKPSEKLTFASPRISFCPARHSPLRAHVAQVNFSSARYRRRTWQVARRKYQHSRPDGNWTLVQSFDPAHELHPKL